MCVCVCVYVCACVCLYNIICVYVCMCTRIKYIYLFTLLTPAAYLNIMPVEMGDIIDHLADLTPHWEVIGYGLGVSDAVKTLRPSEVEPKTKCLRMLEQWIERGQDSTWGKLFDVLMKNQLNSTVAKLRQSVNSS